MRTPAVPLLAIGLLVSSGCADEPTFAGPDYSVGYRDGSRVGDPAFDYTSSGERGSAVITEVMWAGSVEGDLSARIHHPDDIFIEIQNRHPRPIFLTGWRLIVRSSPNRDRMPDNYAWRTEATRTIVLPAPRSGLPVPPNGYAVVAVRTDGAFFEADYVAPDLVLPDGSFEITLTDPDERLVDGVGDIHKERFAGAWDQVVARSMERTQLLFGNRGNSDVSWHSYSLNDFDGTADDSLHMTQRAGVAPQYQTLTFATPGRANSPDYSGNVSSGAED